MQRDPSNVVLAVESVSIDAVRRHTRGSGQRSAVLVVLAIAVMAVGWATWIAWRIERGEPIPKPVESLVVSLGLVSLERLNAATQFAEDRRAAWAIWRNEAANRVRAAADVRAAAWDGDRLLVLLTPGLPLSGGRAVKICELIEPPAVSNPIRIRLEAVDGRGTPVEAWCGHRNR